MATYHRNAATKASSPEYDSFSDSDQDSDESKSMSLPMSESSDESTANFTDQDLEDGTSLQESNFTDSDPSSDDTQEYALPPLNPVAGGLSIAEDPDDFPVPVSVPARRQNTTIYDVGDTEEYEVPRQGRGAPAQNIRINLGINVSSQEDGIVVTCTNDEDDDDVILIPQHIEMIDLCTQTPVAAPRQIPTFTDEVIVIHDSPAGAAATRRNNGQLRSVRRELDASPYKRASASASTSKEVEVVETEEPKSQPVMITCPVCLESVAGRKPVSTTCGHVYCEKCLVAALKVSANCPMCKKSLKGKNAFHSLYFGN